MIYCVEDEPGIRELMVYALNAAGLEARGFPDGAAFWEAIRRQKPDLVLLDIMLPGEDGIEILRHLRKSAATSGTPIIMATAKGTEYDKVLGLDLGADDYLAKPFGMMEMVSRVKAVLRRTGARENKDILRSGGLTVNLREHTVTVDGKRIELTLKEFELLKALMASPGTVFTRGQLLDTVWGAAYEGETRTVDVHVGTLRSKLGACGEMLATVRGVGYRWEAKP